MDIDAYMFREIDGVPEGLSDEYNYDPLNDLPSAEYCFFEEVSIKERMEFTRKPETGKDFKTITRDNYIFSCSIRGLFTESKMLDTSYLKREHKFRIFIMHYPLMSNTSEGKVQFILTKSVVASNSLTSNKQSVGIDISFESERLIIV